MTTESPNARGLPIRDIRADLQQRISMCEDAIVTQQKAYERRQAELLTDHRAKTENLKAAMANYRRLLAMEEVFQTPSDQSVATTATATTAKAASSTADAKTPLVDRYYEELTHKGPKTKDELREIAHAEGYFPPGEGGRAIHATIVNLVRGGRAIEQDGRYVAAAVKQKELI